MSPAARTELLQSLSNKEAEALLYDWKVWARPNQLAPPGNWDTWLILAGRGFGKTRTGAEWAIDRARENPGCRIGLVARTAADVRDTMVEGESGILACSHPNFRPEYEPSKRRLTWPNGAMATTFTGEKPDALRGPQHHFAWADELAFWKYVDDCWNNLQFGLRLGKDPRVIVTTTPRPIAIVKDLLLDPGTHLTRGTTYDNAINLPAKQLAKLRRKYEGTRLGRQELQGEVLDDTPGALWTRALIERYRVKVKPDLIRVVVAVDPAVTSGEESAETGIIAGGKARNGDIYVFEDESGHHSPYEWAVKTVDLYETHKADRVVGEVNNGGDLVEANIRTVKKSISYKSVRASRGKAVRAEPVAALYEQGKVHHVGGLPELEDQMTTFVPDSGQASPDRMDALVWLVTELTEGYDSNLGSSRPLSVPRRM